MRVFLSGPITGHEKTYKDDFARCKKMFEEQEHEVISPIENDVSPKFDNKAWIEYLKKDMDLLITCEAIYMMPGWRDSYGCCIENLIAEKFGLEMWE